MKASQPKLLRLRRGACSIAAMLLALASSAATAEEPWRLGKAIGAPDNLTITGSYRLRYEYLNGAFRAASNGSDQMLAERLLLGAEYGFGRFFIGAEFEDARAHLDDFGTPVGTDDVNAAELLRAYAGYRAANVFSDGDKFDISAGRITIDAGSRRLVARNRFRNTINGFTGVEALWTGRDGDRLQLFYALPVDRRPKDPASLRDNDIAFDEENPHVRFWGALYSKPRLIGRATAEVYVFGLNEDDRPDVATANRNLYTPGFRLFVSPRRGEADFEIETALQAGHSRNTILPSAPELDHFARFHHVSAGYTFHNAWKTRVSAQYDYASGDKDPADGDNNRFDTLFGARRFELGPTGIYGAFARSNISTPGVSIEAQPSKRLSGGAGWRAVFLASKRDAWAGTAVADPSGAAGGFIGNQIEAHLAYNLLPGNVRLETGGAYLINGEFLKEAPNASGNGDTLYLYSQIALSF